MGCQANDVMISLPSISTSCSTDTTGSEKLNKMVKTQNFLKLLELQKISFLFLQVSCIGQIFVKFGIRFLVLVYLDIQGVGH